MELSDIAAKDLELWKVDVPYTARASITEESLKEEDVMGPLDLISEYFQSPLSPKHIHVVVRRPPGVSRKRVGIDLDDLVDRVVKRLREENEEKAASFPASEVSYAIITKAMWHLKLMELPVHPIDFEQYSKMKDRQVDKFKWDEGLSEDQQMDRVLQWFKQHLKLPRYCTFTDTRKENSLKIQLGKLTLEGTPDITFTVRGARFAFVEVKKPDKFASGDFQAKALLLLYHENLQPLPGM
ncbi:hypothetical protein HDU93_006981, partial [Gonapodya sp. JEL0774]